jgi:hypothetical protein
MDMNVTYAFRVSGLSATVIDQFRGLPDEELKKYRVVRLTADVKPGFPCRVTLADAEIGESVLLLNFEHLPGQSPYRSIGPIFVRESAAATYSFENQVPELLRRRLLSVRAYDDSDMLIEAEVVEGKDLEPLIQRFFSNESIAYLHVHNARPGCYHCRIDRA